MVKTSGWTHLLTIWFIIIIIIIINISSTAVFIMYFHNAGPKHAK